LERHQEITVKEKIVSCVLVVSLSFYIGCYSTEMVSIDELRARADQADITVFTKDSLEYTFSIGNYRIQADTLSGYGVRRSNASADAVFDASLSFADIDSIKTREFDPPRTIALCGGIGLGVFLVIMLLFRDNQTMGVAVVVATPQASN
jgi:hypothetical protein